MNEGFNEYCDACISKKLHEQREKSEEEKQEEKEEAKKRFRLSQYELVTKKVELRKQEDNLKKIQAELERRVAASTAARAEAEKQKVKYYQLKAQDAAKEIVKDQKRVVKTAIKLIYTRNEQVSDAEMFKQSEQKKLEDMKAGLEACEIVFRAFESELKILYNR